MSGKKQEADQPAGLDKDKSATKRERPKILKGWTYQMQTGCGPLYVTVNEDATGLFELFTTMGKGRADAPHPRAKPSDAWCRWRGAAGFRRVRSSNSCRAFPVIRHPASVKTRSCPAPTRWLKRFKLMWRPTAARCSMKNASSAKAPVPDCGGIVEHEGGCMVCRICGYSECA